MTTLADRPNTALLVVDVQNGVVAGAYDRDNVVATIDGLVEKARAADVDVVWIQHNSDELPTGSDSWKYVPELERRDSEPLVQKAFGDSFEETDLESVLADRGIGRLFVAGAQTDACVRSTLHGAPPPDQVIAHTNLYWRYHTAPGRTAGTVNAADVDFAANPTA